ncbi:MAG: TnpV protein [Faecalibacterium sp.]|nr:TnpV protein [Ruminococcus sp.]MCM1486455.1 TnpV protein [Faecalibacterium sp.]
MNKHITDEKTGISYTLHGDYYLPDLALPPEEKQSVGIWGQRHLRHIRQYKQAVYTIISTSGKLNSYLAGIDKQAEEMFFQLVKQMMEREGITEKLKDENQIEWVGWINNICNRVTDIVNVELIFA